jgi:hypothetical protein
MLLKSIPFALMLSVLFYGMSLSPAHAYLDPGTGSMILQVLLGGIAGAALAGRFYWHKFLVLIGVKSDAADRERQSDEAAGR